MRLKALALCVSRFQHIVTGSMLNLTRSAMIWPGVGLNSRTKLQGGGECTSLAMRTVAGTRRGVNILCNENVDHDAGRGHKQEEEPVGGPREHFKDRVVVGGRADGDEGVDAEEEEVKGERAPEEKVVPEGPHPDDDDHVHTSKVMSMSLRHNVSLTHTWGMYLVSKPTLYIINSSKQLYTVVPNT